MEILIKGTLLKNLVDAVKELNIKTTSFDFTPHGLSLQSLSPDTSAFVSLFLTPKAFIFYLCEEATSIDLNLIQFSRVLEIVDEHYVVGMRADQGRNNLQVMFENRRPGFPANLLCFKGLELGWVKRLVKKLGGFCGGRRSEVEEMKTPLLDAEVEDERLGIEEEDYCAVVKMKSATFVRVCSELSRDYGLDDVSICVTKNGVEFFNDKRSIMEKAKLLPKLSVKLTGEPVEMIYDLNSLRRFTMATPLSKMVTICISPEIPAMVEYKIKQDLGYIRFYFPPVFEEEDE